MNIQVPWNRRRRALLAGALAPLLVAGWVHWQVQTVVSAVHRARQVDDPALPPLQDPLFAPADPAPAASAARTGRAARPAPAVTATPRAAPASVHAAPAEQTPGPTPIAAAPQPVAAPTTLAVAAHPVTAHPGATYPVADHPEAARSAAPAGSAAVVAPAAPAPARPASSAPPAVPATLAARLAAGQRVHILLMGNDERQLGQGRADVLLLLTLDPVARRALLLSLPRDTRIQLPGRGAVKLNAAYAYGGADLQVRAVERFVGVPIDRYIEVSLRGFAAVIDRLGGVQVEVGSTFEESGVLFTPGERRLDGEQAVAYVRMRKHDPRGDLGRNGRQQQVLRSLLGGLMTLEPARLPGLIRDVYTEVRTDLTVPELLTLRQDYAALLARSRSLDVQGRNQLIAGIWFYLVPDAERQRLHGLIR